MTPESRPLPCLNCGYDLRGQIADLSPPVVVCPECGEGNEHNLLRRQGWRRRHVVQAIGILFVPAVVLTITSWLFRNLGGTPVHLCLCIVLAPAVIPAHALAMREYVSATYLGRTLHKRRLLYGGFIAAVIIDLGALVLTWVWFA